MNKFTDKVLYFNRQLANPLDADSIRSQIESSFLSRYNKVKTISLEELKQSLSFLMRCDLLTATPVFDNFDKFLNVLRNLEMSDSCFRNKNDILGKINFTINYPMFYVEILKEIFGDKIAEIVHKALLGPITECYVRSFLPSEGYEFRDQCGNEIDYVNRYTMEAIEISIRDKSLTSEVHFELLPEGYSKILLTKDGKSDGDVKKIPYYEYLYNICTVVKRLQ